MDLAHSQLDLQRLQDHHLVQPADEDAPPAAIRRAGGDLDLDPGGVDVDEMASAGMA